MKRSGAVLLAAFGLNLALGNLYAWSVVGKQLTEPERLGGFGWSQTESTLPYTAAIVCLALGMVPAGRLQDKYGPRLAATLGAILAGAGLILAGYAAPSRLWPAVLGFGVLTGTGVALGYAAATPAAVKYFPARRRGLVTGIVVAGFGLASLYIAPSTHALLAAVGINASFRILGAAVLVIATGCAQWLRNPPEGEVPLGETVAAAGTAATEIEGAWSQVLRDPNFYTLYLQFAAGSIAGLMIIGHLAKIVALQSRDAFPLGFLLVALLAVFNAGGRVVAGLVSDRIGRNLTIAGFFFAQTINLLLFSRYTTTGEFIAGAAVAGCSYGSCSALFASSAVDCWGARNFGLNYGLLFTSWGVGGVVGPLLAGRIMDVTGSFTLAYRIAAGIMAAATALALLRQAGLPRMRGITARSRSFRTPAPRAP